MDLVDVPAAPPPARTAASERRRPRPLVVAVPYAAWLCCFAAPAALLRR